MNKGVKGFYSSLMKEYGNKRSIQYIIPVRDKQKQSLIEYRLRWQVSDEGDFLRFDEPQYLGDTIAFGTKK